MFRKQIYKKFEILSRSMEILWYKYMQGFQCKAQMQSSDFILWKIASMTLSILNIFKISIILDEKFKNPEHLTERSGSSEIQWECIILSDLFSNHLRKLLMYPFTCNHSHCFWKRLIVWRNQKGQNIELLDSCKVLASTIKFSLICIYFYKSKVTLVLPCIKTDQFKSLAPWIE